MKLKVFILLFALNGVFVSCMSQKYSTEYGQYKVYRNLRKALKHKSEVRILALTNMGLTDFPKEILELTNLKVLNLFSNEIECLPKDIERLQSLEVLEMMGNRLEDLPQEITNLKSLKRLNLAYNEIGSEDVEFIRKVLPDCFIITEIIL